MVVLPIKTYHNANVSALQFALFTIHYIDIKIIFAILFIMSVKSQPCFPLPTAVIMIIIISEPLIYLHYCRMYMRELPLILLDKNAMLLRIPKTHNSCYYPYK